MNTEFLKGLGLNEEQVKAVFAENGKDVNESKKALNERIELLTADLQIAKDTLKSFEGVDVEELKEKANTLSQELSAKETEYQNRLAEIDFNTQINNIIKATNGKSEKAVKAFLDLDTLKQSKNQAEDIKTAIEKVKSENDYLFVSDEPFQTAVKETSTENKVEENLLLRKAMGLK